MPNRKKESRAALGKQPFRPRASGDKVDVGSRIDTGANNGETSRMKPTTQTGPFRKMLLFVTCASILSVATQAADKPKSKLKIPLAEQVAASEARARVKCPDAFKPGTALQSAFWDSAYHYDQTKPGWRNQGDWPEQLIELITHSSPHPEWHTARRLAEMRSEEEKRPGYSPTEDRQSPAQQSDALRRRFVELKAGAERGNALSKYSLAICYRKGEGVEKDDEEAVKWYRQAAEQGHAAAQYGLGYCYAYGEGVERNDAEAVNWYRKAAEQGHVQAQISLSICYQKGIGVPRDLTTAKNLIDGLKPTPSTPARTGNAIAVDMVRENEVLKVPVQINGAITLKFVVDSGASDVQISKDVFLTLIRAETIKEGDFLPGKTFVLADGSKVKSDRFILRSIKVGESTFADIEASVGGLDAALLLGQSFLSRFDEWKIDNKKSQLILAK